MVIVVFKLKKKLNDFIIYLFIFKQTDPMSLMTMGFFLSKGATTFFKPIYDYH
jgi:hypothetical protein